MTPLHVAAEAGSQDIVECLVGKGVNINIKDNNEVCDNDEKYLDICA